MNAAKNVINDHVDKHPASLIIKDFTYKFILLSLSPVVTIPLFNLLANIFITINIHTAYIYIGRVTELLISTLFLLFLLKISSHTWHNLKKHRNSIIYRAKYFLELLSTIIIASFLYLVIYVFYLFGFIDIQPNKEKAIKRIDEVVKTTNLHIESKLYLEKIEMIEKIRKSLQTEPGKYLKEAPLSDACPYPKCSYYLTSDNKFLILSYTDLKLIPGGASHRWAEYSYFIWNNDEERYNMTNIGKVKQVYILRPTPSLNQRGMLKALSHVQKNVNNEYASLYRYIYSIAFQESKVLNSFDFILMAALDTIPGDLHKESRYIVTKEHKVLYHAFLYGNFIILLILGGNTLFNYNHRE